MKERTGMKPNKMKIIGLAGGVGTGKSTVASILKDKFNSYIVMADQVGHKAMEPDTQAYYNIIDLFGRNILKEDKTIDRSKVADIVFHDANMLKRLNQIIHPFVEQYIKREIETVKNMGEYHYFFIESAILIETGYESICDEIWVVQTEEQIRRKRLKGARGYSDEKIDAIIKEQMKEEKLLSYADAVIKNNKGFEEIEQQLENLLV